RRADAGAVPHQLHQQQRELQLPPRRGARNLRRRVDPLLPRDDADPRHGEAADAGRRRGARRDGLLTAAARRLAFPFLDALRPALRTGRVCRRGLARTPVRLPVAPVAPVNPCREVTLNLRCLLMVALFGAALTLPPSSLAGDPARPTNLVVFLADDLGWA